MEVTIDLSVDLTSMLGVKAQHNLRYAADPVPTPAGAPREELDTTSLLSIIAKFSR